MASVVVEASGPEAGIGSVLASMEARRRRSGSGGKPSVVAI